MTQLTGEGVDTGGAGIGEGGNGIDEHLRERFLIALCRELDDGVKQWMGYRKRQLLSALGYGVHSLSLRIFTRQSISGLIRRR